jgi:two-component system OmpR family response regulator
MMETILIVDDDAHIREILRYKLVEAGYKTIEAGNGSEAIEQFTNLAPDLLILDIMMPEMDGTEVCREIRQTSTTPIIFLSSKDEEIDRIVGLELGGDDYVTKPFSPREVVARVKGILRRVQSISASAETINALPVDSESMDENELTHGYLRLDLDRYTTYWDQEEVVLPATGFNILKTLMRRPTKVFTREELMEGAYNDRRIVSDRTIDSHMRTIRKKFASVGGDPIENRRGVGYIMTACD